MRAIFASYGVQVLCAWLQLVGYDGSVLKTMMHQFPYDGQMHSKWLRAINRADFTPTKNSRVCERHFRESDYTTESLDINGSRMKQRNNKPLLRKVLIPGAIPSVFKEQPKYMTIAKAPPRSTKSSSEHRTANDNRHILEMEKQMFELDKVTNLDEVCSKCSILPSGYSLLKRETDLLYLYINEGDSMLKVIAAVQVEENLTLRIFLHDVQIDASKIRHLLSAESNIHVLRSASELNNVLAEVKSWCNEEAPTTSTDILLELSVNYIQKVLETDTALQHQELLHFIVDQLKLMVISKSARHYTPEILVTAFLWHMTSPSLYKKLCNFFALPSVCRLQQLNCTMNVKCNAID